MNNNNNSIQLESDVSESIEDGEDSDSISSSASSSVSSSSSSSTSDEEAATHQDTLELAKISNELLKLPRGFCENANIFHEFFSEETWHLLPDRLRDQLQDFLPNFTEWLSPSEAATEREHTVQMLFSGELKRFSISPLSELQRHLEEGNYRPDVLKLRKSIAKSRRHERRFQQSELISQMAKQLFLSRERLLRCAYKSDPQSAVKMERTFRRKQSLNLYSDTKLHAVRARKRFYTEIEQLTQELGLDENELSLEDDDEVDVAIAEELRRDALHKQKTTIDAPVKPAYTAADKYIYSTLFKRRHGQGDEDTLQAEHNKQPRLSNHNFYQYLREHKRRKLTEPSLPDFETVDIRLRDVCARAQLGGHFKRIFAAGKAPGRKPKHAKAQINEPPALVPIQQVTAQGKFTDAATMNTVVQAKLSNNNVINSNNSSETFNTKFNAAAQEFHDNSLVHSADGDVFNIMDNEVELQQEEVETYGTCEETIPAYVISNEVILPAASQNTNELSANVVQRPPLLSTTTKNRSHVNEQPTLDVHHQQQSQSHLNMTLYDVPKLEPIVQSHKSSVISNADKFSLASAGVPATPTSTRNISNVKLLQNSLSSPSALRKTMSALNMTLNRTATNKSYVANTELIQETHACFFSLIRDFFCATPNHRMKFDDLKGKTDIWLCNPITALNDWYSQVDNWSSLLTSAINFLAGNFVELPDEYVPYIEHKTQMNIYQWIGAGRDSDTRLTALCNFWMQRRNDMFDKSMEHEKTLIDGKSAVAAAGSGVTAGTATTTTLIRSRSSEIEEIGSYGCDSGVTPPPAPRCPTTWTVRAATADEVIEFQRQERERFESPHRAYTYRMHGYESVVGPVKGIYSQILALTKARGHSMMIGDRPNFVTILTLVRDATARLPNGEGTRADISELLKCSQYINRDAAENVLQTIVSGALDRMHTEHDPCVRYDPKRKIWIYLHRNRSEEEFERMHQQYQGLGKNKKLSNRKQKLKTVAKAEAGGGGGGVVNSDLDVTTGSNVLTDRMTSTATPNSGLPATPNITFSLPALVPANPVIVNSQATHSSGQQASSKTFVQQSAQHKQSVLPKCPPVPPLKYNIPPNQQQKSLLKNTLHAQRLSEAKTTADNVEGQHQLLTPLNQTNRERSLTPTISVSVAGKTTTAQLAKQFTFSVPQMKSGSSTVNAGGNTTPIIVATPTGLQTVHVSNATSVTTPASNIQLHSSVFGGAVGGKKVALNKPVIINQITQQTSATKSQRAPQSAKQSQQQVPQQQQHSFIIPIHSMASSSNEMQKSVATLTNSGKVVVATATAAADRATPSKEHSATAAAAAPRNIQTIFVDGTQQQKALVQQQQQQKTQPKNVIRLVPTISNNNGAVTAAAAATGSAVKSIISTTPVAGKQQSVQIIGQRVIANAGSGAVTLRSQYQQQKIGAGDGTISLITSGNAAGSQNVATPANPAGGGGGGTIVKMSPQAFATLQQNKQGQHILVKHALAATSTQQHQPRIVVGNTAIIAQSAQGVNKNIVVQQHQPGATIQKSPANSGTVASVASSGGVNKIQTISASNLTPQQQRVLLQNLKQQQQQQQQQQQIQYKTVQVVANSTQQQSQQLQQKHTDQQQVVRGHTVTVVPQRTTSSAQTSTIQQGGKTVVVVSQPQGLTRLLKSVNNVSQQQQQHQQITNQSKVSSESSTATRVFTNQTGQIISLESLLQKQSGALRITGGGNTISATGVKSSAAQKTNLIQLTTSNAGTVIQQGTTQYAVVSQPRNIISLGGATHRLITTQAGSNTNTVLTAPVGVSAAAPKTVATTAKMIATAASGLTKANVATGTSGNIRVVTSGASGNFNIANIQGKQVLFATKTTPATNVKNVTTLNAAGAAINTQQIQNVIIGGQTVKIQGNLTNVQQISKATAGGNIINPTSTNAQQTVQTVIMGNQILRMQQMSPAQTIKSAGVTQNRVFTVANAATSKAGGITNVANANEALLNSNIANTTTSSSNSNSSNIPKALVLDASGQTIRLHSPLLTSSAQSTQTQQQQMTKNLVTSHNNVVKSVAGNRVVLAVQGGGQIFLSPTLQGSSLNLKSLQNMKVVSLAQAQHKDVQQQQQDKIAIGTNTQTKIITSQQHQQSTLKSGGVSGGIGGGGSG